MKTIPVCRLFAIALGLSASLSIPAVKSDTLAVATAPVIGNSNWVQSDIGAVGKLGTASFADKTFTITSTGADIWNDADGFHFINHPINGDGSIIARVVSIGPDHDYSNYPWAKAGVMIRETLEPGSEFGMMLVSAKCGVASVRRTETGKGATRISGAMYTTPYWVRLDRQGDTFTAYNSIDAVKWEKVDSFTIKMPKLVFAGLALSSHETSHVVTAKFDHVFVSFH